MPEILPSIIQLFVIISTSDSKQRMLGEGAASGNAASANEAERNVRQEESTTISGKPLLERGSIEVPDFGENDVSFSEATATMSKEERMAIERELGIADDDDNADVDYSHIEEDVGSRLRDAAN